MRLGERVSDDVVIGINRNPDRNLYGQPEPLAQLQRDMSSLPEFNSMPEDEQVSRMRNPHLWPSRR